MQSTSVYENFLGNFVEGLDSEIFLGKVFDSL